MTDRKARLAALAAKAGRNKKPDEDDGQDQHQAEQEEETAPAAVPSIKFRNYTPADASLEQKQQPTDDGEPESKRPRTDATTTASNDSNKKSALERALEQAKAEAAAASAVPQATASQEPPKKINWDLKRDIQPKLDKLEKRTQKAIVALLRERLEKEAAEQAEGDLD